MSQTVRVFALARHRIGIDGVGVTTLLTLHGCPLRCVYCLNERCHDPQCPCTEVTASQVVELCMKDNLYFLATGGGITVGGGEPLMQPRFIHELRAEMPAEWKLNIETSLNVPQQNLEMIIDDVDCIIIDIKDMNPEIYQRYTSKENTQVVQNLSIIRSRDRQDDTLIRLPLIPSYNTQADREESKKQLSALGFTHFDEFDYISSLL